MPLPAFSKRDEALLYVLGTFLATGFLVGTASLFGVKYEGPGALFLAVSAMAIPAIVSLVAWRGLLRRPIGALGFRPHFGLWYLAVLVFPLAVAFATLALSLLFSGVELDLDLSRQLAEAEAAGSPAAAALRALRALSVPPIAVMVLSALPAGASVNALVALGEELGWRGYLFAALSEQSFARRSLTTGLLWGAWHVPLVLAGHNNLGDPLSSVLFTFLFCVAWAPMFDIVRTRSRTVLTSAILHGTINATGTFAPALTVGGTLLTTSAVGIPGVVAAFLLSAIVIGVDLSREDSVVRGRFVAQ